MAKEPEYTIAELIEATGATARTIRSWVRKGLLRAPPFRGRATTYGPEHVARIHAIQALRKRRLSLREVKKRLASATPEDIEHLLAPARRPIEDVPPPGPPAYPAERWERIVLAPGLEVHVRADAGELLRRVADAIYRHYGSTELSEGLARS